MGRKTEYSVTQGSSVSTYNSVLAMSKLSMTAAITLSGWLIGGWLLLPACVQAQVQNQAQSQTRVRVQAQPLQQLTISVLRSLPAEVISLRQAIISSQLVSTVIELPLLLGDALAPGQLIAKLECIDQVLAYQRSKATLAALSASRVLADQQLRRLNKLHQSNNASEEQINQKQEQLNVVTARINAQSIAINIDQRQVNKCEIRAPFSGTVSQIHSEVGNFVSPGSDIVSLVDTDNIELTAQVGHSDLEHIKTATRLSFLFQNQSYPLSLKSVLPVIDPVTQSQQIRLTFSATKPLVGSIGRLQWRLPGNILPATLLVTRNQKNGVFVVEHSDVNNAVARFIAIAGAKQGQPAAVVLDTSSLIITDGRFGLVDGDQVILD